MDSNYTNAAEIRVIRPYSCQLVDIEFIIRQSIQLLRVMGYN
jgi:hypothetical protein